MSKVTRLRICIAPNALGQGGIGTSLIRLTHGFLALGFVVEFVLTAPPEKDFGRLKQLDERVRVHRLGNRTYLSISKFFLYVMRSKPDIVITAHNPVFVAFALIKLMLPRRLRPVVIHQVHTHRSIDLPMKGFIGKLHDRLMRSLIHYADAIVGVSSGVARDFELGVGLSAGSIRVIHNAIDENAFGRAEKGPDNSEFNDKAFPILLAVGRLTAQKDYPTLFRAFKNVLEAVRCRLVILGDGDLMDELKGLCSVMKLQDHVCFVGHVEDPKPFFSFSDVFVSSSSWEGMPVAHLEALASGLPVICTDCPSGPAELLENGRYGTLVPVGDADALAKAIISRLNNPSNIEPLISRAKEFTQEKIAEQYLELFQSIKK